MSMIITQPAQAICLPAPRVAIDVRPATLEDFAFIDRLQKKHTRQVGFMHAKALEGKIAAGHVLMACSEPRASARGSGTAGDSPEPLLEPVPEPLPYRRGSELGFVIGTDRYFKRDDCGIIYQLCVEEGQRRSLVGAMLVKAMFDRAAYGCRLFCCWCAQDIEANRFWESLGFVPLAYRAGSEKKRKGGRVHIFWQKRIRPGDVSTPWWFPAKTDAGSMREDRLVLPIPPGVHWSDDLPVLELEPRQRVPQADASPPAPSPRRRRRAAARVDAPQLVPGIVASPQAPTPNPRKRAYVQFGPPPAVSETLDEPRASASGSEPLPDGRGALPEMAPRPRREKRKADSRLIAAARELRDRWLEKLDENPSLILPQGKYDVARELPEANDRRFAEPRLIESEVKALPEAA